jgi:hypothetical protein
MKIKNTAQHLVKFVFYLGLGGWTALVSACSESSDGRKSDAGSSSSDSEVRETGAVGHDSAVDATRTPAADAIADAASDGSLADSSSSPSDAGREMWDVICE